MGKKSLPKDLERLHGRLIWFSAFVFGRMINQMVKQVSAMSLQRTRVVQFDDFFLSTLCDLKETIIQAKPVSISRSLCTPWIFFTDGAYEPGTECLAALEGRWSPPEGSSCNVLESGYPPHWSRVFWRLQTSRSTR
jgi:hypothetical protein